MRPRVRGWFRSPAGRCRCSTPGSVRSMSRCATGVGVFDVSHMGEIETSGPDAEAFLQRILSNDVSKIAEDGAQYSVLCKDDGGVLDDLFSYRLGPDRFLTVTNASNHEKDLAWFKRHAADFDVTVEDRLHDYAMLAVQGPRGARARRAARGRRAAEAVPDHHAHGGGCAQRPRRRHRLHGRGRRRAAARAGACDHGVGRAHRAGRDADRPRRPRHPPARGLLPPLRQRPVRGARPDRGRPGLVLQGGHRLRRLGRRSARSARTAPPSSSFPSS